MLADEWVCGWSCTDLHWLQMMHATYPFLVYFRAQSSSSSCSLTTARDTARSKLGLFPHHGAVLKSIAKKQKKKTIRHGSLPPPGQSDFARLVHGRKLADTKRDPCLMQFRLEFLMPDEHRSVRGPSFTPFFYSAGSMLFGPVCTRRDVFLSHFVFTKWR